MNQVQTKRRWPGNWMQQSLSYHEDNALGVVFQEIFHQRFVDNELVEVGFALAIKE